MDKPKNKSPVLLKINLSGFIRALINLKTTLTT